PHPQLPRAHQKTGLTFDQRNPDWTRNNRFRKQKETEAFLFSFAALFSNESKVHDDESNHLLRDDVGFSALSFSDGVPGGLERRVPKRPKAGGWWEKERRGLPERVRGVRGPAREAVRVEERWGDTTSSTLHSKFHIYSTCLLRSEHIEIHPAFSPPRPKRSESKKNCNGSFLSSRVLYSHTDLHSRTTSCYFKLGSKLHIFSFLIWFLSFALRFVRLNIHIRKSCPAELRFGDGDACKSACEAFRSPEYCCSGAYATPSTCRPSVYSQMFKAACPRSYSYAYDDATSTFTCAGGDYTVTFCPSSPSQKSTSYPTPVSDSSATSQGSDPVPGSDAGYSGQGEQQGQSQGDGYGSQGTGSGNDSGETMLQDGSWMAGLAMGDSSRLAGTSLATLLAAFTFGFMSI
ncbi:unnamed protein product, partial [Thlaspi arvense]